MAELLLEALSRAWRALDRLGLPMALMGGLAVAVWKHVRATRDVDLLVGIGPANPEELLRQLAGTDLRAKRHAVPVSARLAECEPARPV